jgi:hypothetical protein
VALQSKSNDKVKSPNLTVRYCSYSSSSTRYSKNFPRTQYGVHHYKPVGRLEVPSERLLDLRFEYSGMARCASLSELLYLAEDGFLRWYAQDEGKKTSSTSSSSMASSLLCCCRCCRCCRSGLVQVALLRRGELQWSTQVDSMLESEEVREIVRL